MMTEPDFLDWLEETVEYKPGTPVFEIIGEFKSEEEAEKMQKIFVSAAYQNKRIMKDYGIEDNRFEGKGGN